MKLNSTLIIGALGVALAAWGAYRMTKLPRGIRNNNPGNIEANAIRWNGQTGDDGRFVTFDRMESGVRALTILISNYYYRHGLTTIRGMISRYAPSIENDTESYVNHVAHKAGLNPDEHIQPLEPYLRDIVDAIITHENGRSIADYDLARGVTLGMEELA
ncbi:MAG: structural protein P5 [Xanthomonadaceae bacterium]|nr:structural protein P5 [Xanthomonadaceae bacterium]